MDYGRAFARRAAGGYGGLLGGRGDEGEGVGGLLGRAPNAYRQGGLVGLLGSLINGPSQQEQMAEQLAMAEAQQKLAGMSQNATLFGGYDPMSAPSEGGVIWSQGRKSEQDAALGGLPQPIQEGLLSIGRQNPEQAGLLAAQFRMEQAKPKAPITLREGESLLDPTTYKPLATGAPNLPEGMRIGANGQPEWVPGFLQGKQAVASAGRQINQIDLREQGAEAKTVGEFYGTQFRNLQEGGLQAQQMNNRIDRLAGLLEQVNTGAFTGTGQQFKAAAKGLGFDLASLGIPDDVAPAQAAAALSNELALQLRNPAGGAGMPGALSDKDREFLVSMVPGLEQTPEGRRMMVDTMKRLNRRSMEVAEMARKYRQSKGQLDEGFFDQLQQFSDSNRLFQDAPNAPQGGAPTAAARFVWRNGQLVPE